MKTLLTIFLSAFLLSACCNDEPPARKSVKKEKTEEERLVELRHKLEKLEYASYLKKDLKRLMQPNLRWSNEFHSQYVFWFEKGDWWKGYYITIDKSDKVIKIETKLKE